MSNNIHAIQQYNQAPSGLECNAQSLEVELAWCEKVIETSFLLYFQQESQYEDIFDIALPAHHQSDSYLADFIHHHRLGFIERLAFVLALAPAIKPRLLDPFLHHNEQINRPYTEFGCIVEDGQIYATGETLAFLLGGDNVTRRFQVQNLLQTKEKTGLHTALALSKADNDALLMKTALRVTDEYLHRFTTSEPYRPDLCPDFPASLVTANLDWQDLVLPDSVMAQILEIQSWITHAPTLVNDWGLGSRIRPGYRALFYGPPGTGKTLTACLLGHATGRDVYKIDLSLVISKYIGETEKNLEKVFSQAEDKSWILFFDEADALFGKRVQASGANDQFANQNVAYLLQRIEQFNGIVILASNLVDNLDEAFYRRFESMIYFPTPDAEQRLSLWQKGFSVRSQLEPDIDLSDIASGHILSGAEIMNVIRYASLKAICRGSTEIKALDLMEGIRREDEKKNSSPARLEQEHLDIFG